MKKHHHIELPEEIYQTVATLQEDGFEAYVVGGAVRDHLLGRTPKDYDIATSATPEEVRQVFGRRHTRIIGKRFRLVHLFFGRDIVEISTFRRKPDSKNQLNIITSDNSYGTAAEDAERRDFTVNSLFYDPVRAEIIDYTGMGIEDIRNGTVRAIGDARERFEEDPVRIVRALKLVGQYDFSMECATENALFKTLPMILYVSKSRLTLEFEKILTSSYGDKHLQAFHDFGLLQYFLPVLEENWGKPSSALAMEMLTERNYRVEEGMYRSSISLAAAALAYPFIGERMPKRDEMIPAIKKIFRPQEMMNRVIEAVARIIRIQKVLGSGVYDESVTKYTGYSHGRELLLIREHLGNVGFEVDSVWPPGNPNAGFSKTRTKTKKRRIPHGISESPETASGGENGSDTSA